MAYNTQNLKNNVYYKQYDPIVTSTSGKEGEVYYVTSDGTPTGDVLDTYVFKDNNWNLLNEENNITNIVSTYRNISLPVITCGTGLGQDGREVATIEGDSTSGIISFTTSSHVVSNTELFTVNFSKPFEKTVYPVLFSASPLLEDTINYIYVTNVSNQGFTVMIGNKNNLQNYTNYKLTYNVL